MSSSTLTWFSETERRHATTPFVLNSIIKRTTTHHCCIAMAVFRRGSI